VSQLRLNPLTGRWVTIVSERAERPSDFAPRTNSVEADPTRPCPFCPGNEEATLPALESVDDNGAWRMRVVPNLYPAFDGDERPRYGASLASVTEHDGTLYVLCFSDDGPDTGPHPISQEELKAAFNPSNGWNVIAIEPDRLQTRFHDDGAPASVRVRAVYGCAPEPDGPRHAALGLPGPGHGHQRPVHGQRHDRPRRGVRARRF